MSRSTDRLKRSRIGVAALIVSGGILISRLLGVVREMIFAAFLGADSITDQYVAAFRIPDYANYLLANNKTLEFNRSAVDMVQIHVPKTAPDAQELREAIGSALEG